MLNSHLHDSFDRWSAPCLSSARWTAEEGIHAAYRAAGLPPPQRIIWCGSPVGIAEALAAASSETDFGANVKSRLFTEPLERTRVLAEIFWKELIIAQSERRFISKSDAPERTPGVIHAGQLETSAADAILFRLSVRARQVVRRWHGLPRLLPRESFAEIAVGPADLATLGFYQYVRDDFGWNEETESLLGLFQIAKTAGCFVPHADVCWIAERPEVFRLDATGRLHCADGPALRHGDGWSAYAWKGVDVPAWTIEHPEWITRDTIGDEIDAARRDAMIDIMTPKRFIESGDPVCISKDDTGILWFRRWSHRGATIGSWAAVEVANGTAGPGGVRKSYFLRVPSHLRTARDAVAWTYGLTADQYAHLTLRT